MEQPMEDDKLNAKVDLTWKPLTVDTAPEARYMHASSEFDPYLLVFGGAGVGTKTPFILNTSTGQWSQIAASNQKQAPSHRWGNTATRINEFIVFFGGWDSTSQFNDIAILDVVNRKWVSPNVKSDAVPPHRSLHTATATHDGKLIIFGGSICVGGPYHYYNDVWVYDLAKSCFRELKTSGEIPEPRAQHAAVLVKKKFLYILCGADAATMYNSVHILDLETLVWRKVKVTGNSPPSFTRKRAAVNFKVSSSSRGQGVLYGNHIILYGGPNEDENVMNCIFAFDIETECWKTIELSSSRTSPDGIRFFALNAIENRLFLFGGVSSSGASNVTYYIDLDLLPLNQITIPESSFSPDLSSLINNEQFSDFTFIFSNQTETRKLHAISGILSCRCPYFKALFSHSMMKESQSRQLVITDFKYEDFYEVIRYIYTDKALITPENAFDVAAIANRFNLDRLQSICEQVIVKHLNTDSVATVITSAETLNLVNLKRIAFYYAIAHYKQLALQELSEDLRDRIKKAFIEQSTKNSFTQGVL